VSGSKPFADASRSTYESPDTVAHYSQDTDLHPPERLLFERYLRPGMAILDIGVGAGRSVPYLSAIGRPYIGVDYSAAMIEACRARFPGHEFLHADATDLGRFADASFDAVVFTLNGIDTIQEVGQRTRCLRECARVLREGGTFIYSVHYARFLCFPPRWRNAGLLKRGWRIVYAIVQSLRNIRHRLPSAAFWQGAGYVVDPLVYGQLRLYAATRARVVEELRHAGLEALDCVNGYYPERWPPFATPWYYYAARRANASA
jgi:SAM-dependent methyltransferase